MRPRRKVMGKEIIGPSDNECDCEVCENNGCLCECHWSAEVWRDEEKLKKFEYERENPPDDAA